MVHSLGNDYITMANRVEIKEQGKNIVSISLPPSGLIVGAGDEADICLPGVEKGTLWRLVSHEDGVEITVFSNATNRTKVKTRTIGVGDNDRLGPYELTPVAFKRRTRGPTKKLHYDSGSRTLVTRSVTLIIKSPQGGPEKLLSLPEGRSVFGKDSSCDIVLNDVYVSGRHMALIAVQGQVTVEDLGSRNGVFISGQKLTISDVADGQTIRLGETDIVLQSEKSEEIIDEPKLALPGLVGDCEAVRLMTALIGRVAPTDVTVLIEGETGTGKEVVARGIHALSKRSAGPFIALNCSAIPKDLFESELFGHEKGAFTGAGRERRGLFLLAAEGTLFLDEISELPPDMQARLLRVLDDHRIRPVGSEREIQCDVRIVAASNKNLEELAAKNAFRDDLLYRLRMIPIHLPPLRMRGRDIELLARHFLAAESEKLGMKNPGLTSSAIEALNGYRWPGNVRELKSAVVRTLVMNPAEGPIGDSDFFWPESSHKNSGTLKDIEAQAIRLALHEEKTRENAARRLGIAPSTLYEKIKKYNL